MDDGSEIEVVAGDVVAIPPGHDAKVPGDEPCVMVDFGEIGDYAKKEQPVQANVPEQPGTTVS